MSEQKPFSITLRSYVEDTDYSGIIYHTNYLKYMERARTEFLIHLGYTLRDLEKLNIAFVIFKINIDYLRPLKLNDRFIVTAEVTHLGNTSMQFTQNIINIDNPDNLYSHAEVKLVCIDINTHRPIFIPKLLREILK